LCGSNWTPSIVPRADDHDVYLVAEDPGRLGRVWREADYEANDFETVVTDLLTAQYSGAFYVVCFNSAEGWARDVSEDIVKSFAGDAICSCETCPPTQGRLAPLTESPGLGPLGRPLAPG
jgi:hypothetical protein